MCIFLSGNVHSIIPSPKNNEGILDLDLIDIVFHRNEGES